MGYTNYGSAKDGENVSSRNGIDSGVNQPSFIGFRGTEDLGNGLKAGFNMQYRLNPDNGEFVGSGSSARDTFLFVQGGFGTVAAGRLTTPQEAFLGSIDPFASAGIVGYGESYTRGAQLINGSAVTRLNNTVAYISPAFSGLTVTAAYSWSALADESNGNKSAGGDARVWALSPVYKNGPLVVGANYHQVKLKTTAGDGDKETVWDLGASYDFGVAKLAAAYGQDKVEFEGESEKVKQWFVGVTVPVGAAGKVMATYGEAELKKVSGAEVDRWAVGYTHDLSKRTMAYATYGSLDLGREADEIGFKGYKSAYERGIGVGLQHRF